MTVGRNIIANFAGRVWSALMSFCFVPLYVRYLGIESYGLVGIFSSLMSVLVLLEFGMAQTLVREAARSKVSDENLASFQSLVGSLEFCYAGIATFFVFILCIFSDSVAVNWLESSEIDFKTIAISIQIMAFVAASRWIGGLYRSGLIGLHRQVWLNNFDIIFSTMRSAGVIPVLLVLYSTVEAFFIFQGIVSILEFAILRYRLRKEINLPSFGFSLFSFNDLRKVWRFAGGVSLVTLFGSSISQLDKILLPGLVSLEAFGVYMLANSIGRAISQLAIPVATAYRPVFVQLVCEGKEADLRKAYHVATQYMVLAVLPVAIVLSVFAEPLVSIWVGDAKIAQNAAPLVLLISLGSALNGLANLPYSIQLAFGNIQIAIKQSLFTFVFFITLFFLSVPSYGVIASAFLWLLINFLNIIISIWVTDRYFVLKSARRWLFNDTFPAILCIFCVVVFIRFFMPNDSGLLFWLYFILSLLCAFLAGLYFLLEIKTRLLILDRNI